MAQLEVTGHLWASVALYTGSPPFLYCSRGLLPGNIAAYTVFVPIVHFFSVLEPRVSCVPSMCHPTELYPSLSKRKVVAK
jgi:hypothetical protein